MKNLFLFLTITALTSCSVGTSNLHKNIQAALEYAYMKGQVDAVTGNINIKQIGDDYMWTSEDGAHQMLYFSEYERRFTP